MYCSFVFGIEDSALCFVFDLELTMFMVKLIGFPIDQF